MENKLELPDGVRQYIDKRRQVASNKRPGQAIRDAGLPPTEDIEV